MARRKLTLTIDPATIESAKKYASERGLSLSRVVERYLRHITTLPKRASRRGRQQSLVDQLSGISSPSGGKEEYRRHLEEKYGDSGA